MLPDYGIYPAFHVCCGYQGQSRLARRDSLRVEHDWLLEPDHCVAQGRSRMTDLAPHSNITVQLLIPWRFFRLWALADGLDPPENMVRCMANNYSAFGFWRAWHRSYNLWIIRYLHLVQLSTCLKLHAADTYTFL